MALRHLVLLQFKPETPEAERDAVVALFAALPEQIPEVLSLEWGTNVSPEGLAKGYTHCFNLAFAGPAERDRYLPHPAHQAFVARLTPWLAQVLVFDYAV